MSGGTIEDGVETLLETIISYIIVYVKSNTHTHTGDGYIPWIHKSVIKKIGCGTSHKYTKYTNLQFQNTTNFLQ